MKTEHAEARDLRDQHLQVEAEASLASVVVHDLLEVLAGHKVRVTVEVLEVLDGD